MWAPKTISFKRTLPVFLAAAAILTWNACIKPTETDSQNNPDPSVAQKEFNATHGSVKLTLPPIDLKSLSKTSVDTSGDSGSLPVQATLIIVVAGAGMDSMVSVIHLPTAGNTVTLTGIPTGERTFIGRLHTINGNLTHSGRSVAYIHPGSNNFVFLNLVRDRGGAEICVTIEGMPNPACSDSGYIPPGDSVPRDTIIPPPHDSIPRDTVVNPPRDTAGTTPNLCWAVQTTYGYGGGFLTLFDPPISGRPAGYAGTYITDADTLQVTTWAKRGDSLSFIVITQSPIPGEKWLFNGVVDSSGFYLSGSIFRTEIQDTAGFVGKPTPCRDFYPAPPIVDTMPTIPPIDFPTTPPETFGFPLPQDSASTSCFTLRYDYGVCEVEGTVKMTFKNGVITHGNIYLGNRFYLLSGKYGEEPISLFGTSKPDSLNVGNAQGSLDVVDTLSLTGLIATDRQQAKGEFLRLPSGKRGAWLMQAKVCADWVPKPNSCPQP